MEFTIAVKDLKPALARVLTIAGKRSTMDILENVLVDARDDSLALTASDLEVTSIGQYPAEVSKKGAITLPAKKFYEMVASLDEGDEAEANVTVRSREGKGVDIISGPVKYQLIGMSADEFPALPSTDDAKFVPVDNTALAQMINRTLFAVSTDETRYNLNGVFFEPGGGDVLKLVATDGHRLALAEGHLAGAMGFGLKEGVILPRKALNEILKLLQEDKESGQLAFTKNHAVFKGERVTLITRLIDGQFPDYAQVIPSDHDKRAELAVTRMLRALRHTNPLSSSKAKSVKLEFSDGKVVVSSSDPEIGTAHDEFEAEYKGETLAIGFNPKYLFDALAVLGDEGSVAFELANDLSPVVVRPVSEGEGREHLCVIMPMRI